MKTDINGATITESVANVLAELQADGNECIGIYTAFLEDISDILFQMGGQENELEPKDKLFKLLHTGHLLRKDLKNLMSV